MNRLLIAALYTVCATAIGHAQTFDKTKWIDASGKEVPVTLDFDKQGQRLTVKSLDASVAEVPYTNISKLSYEQAARHRVKEGAIVMIASFGAGGIVMLTKSKSYWLYVDYKDARGNSKDLTLKLDKGEYKEALKIAKEQTGKDVERLDPQKKTSEKKKDK